MLRKFINDTSGNFSLMMGGSILTLFGAIGLSVDYLAMTDAAARLQSATDRAVLTAAQSTSLSEADSIGLADESFISIEATDGTVVRQYEFLSDVIVVSAQLEYKPVILGLFGIGNQTISTSSTAPNIEFSGVDISLVLDVTGSMKGTKLEDLKEAVGGFLDEFGTFNTDVRVSVVPFAQYVNIESSSFSIPTWLNNSQEGGTFPATTNPSTGATVEPVKVWDGCVGPRLTPYDLVPEYGGNVFTAVYDDGNIGAYEGQPTRYSCPDPLLPLTDDLNIVKNKVDSLSAKGRTSIPDGLMWGWRTLDPRLPYSHTNKGKPRRQILVLMTDGGNTVVQTPGSVYNQDDEKVLGESVVNRADDSTRTICENINLTTDISVYSIAFDISNQNTIDLIRSCASQPEFFFDAADDGNSLETAFLSISEGLVVVRLIN